jgi:hypothetical protein
MQLALIVQLSIALMARQLAGGLPLGPGAGAAIALVRAARGVPREPRRAWRASADGIGARRAQRTRFFADATRAWAGSPPPVACAWRRRPNCPTALPARGRRRGKRRARSVAASRVSLAGKLVASFVLHPVESPRAREPTVVRHAGCWPRPLHPKCLLAGGYVWAHARAGLVAPALVPLMAPIVLSGLARCGCADARAWPTSATDPELWWLAGLVTSATARTASCWCRSAFRRSSGFGRLADGESLRRRSREQLAREAQGSALREIWVSAHAMVSSRTPP